MHFCTSSGQHWARTVQSEKPDDNAHVTETSYDTRDQGLARAVGRAGGVGALARALGISQPSVSGWTRVPSDRVLAVERVTGIRRSELRPDLYPPEAESAVASAQSPTSAATRPDGIDEMSTARGHEYLLLASLLAKAPSAELLARIATIPGDPSPLGILHARLAAAARATSAEAAGTEYFNLFIGVGRGELVPFASFYLTGFLYERPLAGIRSDLHRLGVERQPHVFEPEDHIAHLLETMGGMCLGTLPGGGDDQQHLFATHIAPWAPRFFADLATAEAAGFYRAVADLGSFWIELEQAAFELPG